MTPNTPPSRGGRGLTLVELMAGLVLSLAVAGVACRLLLANQRVARAQAEHAGMQDNVRAGALIVANELRELGFDSVPPLAALGADGAASSDILLGHLGRIRYRAMRGLGFTCLVPATSRLLVRGATYHGLRPPVANVDSIALFVEGDPALSADDAWVRARVTGVASASCPDGAPAIALDIAWEAALVGAAAEARAVSGGPVRVFEVMEIQYYPQNGKSWLGLRSVSRGEAIQPLVGPLADSTATGRGFTLAYLDRNDAGTDLMAEVRTVAIQLRGVTAQPVGSMAAERPTVDSLVLTTRVALRNMARP